MSLIWKDVPVHNLGRRIDGGGLDDYPEYYCPRPSLYRRILYSDFVGDVRYLTHKAIYRVKHHLANCWMEIVRGL